MCCFTYFPRQCCILVVLSGCLLAVGNTLYNLLQTLVPGTAGEAPHVMIRVWELVGIFPHLYGYSFDYNFLERVYIHSLPENFPHLCGFIVTKRETGRSGVWEVFGGKFHDLA